MRRLDAVKQWFAAFGGIDAVTELVAENRLSADSIETSRVREEPPLTSPDESFIPF
jgi:hypothetical protein